MAFPMDSDSDQSHGSQDLDDLRTTPFSKIPPNQSRKNLHRGLWSNAEESSIEPMEIYGNIGNTKWGANTYRGSDSPGVIDHLAGNKEDGWETSSSLEGLPGTPRCRGSLHGDDDQKLPGMSSDATNCEKDVSLDSSSFMETGDRSPTSHSRLREQTYRPETSSPFQNEDSSNEESSTSGPEPIIEEPSSSDTECSTFQPNANDLIFNSDERNADTPPMSALITNEWTNDVREDDDDDLSAMNQSWLESSSSASRSEDESAISFMECSQSATKKKDDVQADVLNAGAPPLYDPTKSHSENWHGDVRRTVTMLEETMAGMPMPNDEGAEDITLPPGLVELYAHQKYALRWMSWREGYFPGGGILADEMGLGKTIEVIALLMTSKRNARKSGKPLVSTEMATEMNCIPSRGSLVVVPLGCIPQWIQEIKTKGSGLKVYTYHDSKKDIPVAELAKYDVVITTYRTISNEVPRLTIDSEDPPPKKRSRVSHQSPLTRIYWVRIVLDEAHQIRNPKTNAAQSIYQLQARFRWAVTGTPIHNCPGDFYSMCTFLRMTPFDDLAVWQRWIGMKAINLYAGAKKRLHVLGKALILRRTKQEVGLANDGKLQVIPPKTVEVVDLQMGDEERKIYDMLMEYARSVLQTFLFQKEQRALEQEVGGLTYSSRYVQEKTPDVPEDIKYTQILAILTRLRQCAVLPHLVKTMMEGEEEKISDEVEFDDSNPDHILSNKNPAMDRLFVSSKFKKILEDVDELRSKAKKMKKPMEKVIIVSCWTTTLDILYEHLQAKDYNCVFITGREDMYDRMDSMVLLNREPWRPQILLLSLMAGGVGLNLVGANHVFFLEPHWNPQHELQAQDRVHRFGQTKNVFIKRYIIEDTIESRILALQKQKRELADGLLSNTKKNKGAGISLEQVMSLFDMPSRGGKGFDDY